MSHSSPQPTFRSISAADFLSPRQLEEGRFLRTLKGVLREQIAERAAAEGLNQAQLAERSGMDPAQLSRALNPDMHVSSRTLFRLAYALDRRWQLTLAPLAATHEAGCRAAAVPRQVSTNPQGPVSAPGAAPARPAQLQLAGAGTAQHVWVAAT